MPADFALETIANSMSSTAGVARGEQPRRLAGITPAPAGRGEEEAVGPGSLPTQRPRVINNILLSL